MPEISLKILLFFVSFSLPICLAVYGNRGACKTKKYKDIDVDWNEYTGKWYVMKVS